jgi:RND family efflux transporter MFP subunit
MLLRNANNSFRRWCCILCLLLLTLVFAEGVAVSGGPSKKAGPAPGLSWPELLVRFTKLSAAEQKRLIEKAGLGDLSTQKVIRGTLREEVVARGTLEATRNSDVICALRARSKNSPIATTIKWVIDDGISVKKGDKLIELDDSGLREELNRRALDLEQARAALVKAEENLKLVQTENEIDVRLREIDLRIAELSLKRDKGKDRDLKEELQLKIEQARLGLQRMKAQAGKKEAEAKAEVLAKAAVVNLEKARKNEVEAELPKCVFTAPQDGIVLYYLPEQVRGGGGSQQAIVAQGEPVREGQKLLQIPDLSQFQVRLRVPEAFVSHLRNEDPLDPPSWQRALIQVDAFPGRVLKGHVKTVDTVASQQDWFASDVKVYKTIISMDEPLKGLKPGMSAEIRIAVQQTPGPVLHVPVQSVVMVGKKRFCFVVTDKEVHQREVVTGLSNDLAVEIVSGLKEGERVLQSPRALARRLALWFDKEGKPAADKDQSRSVVPAPILVHSVKPADEGGSRGWVATYGLTYQDLERITALPAVLQVVPVRSFPYDARRLDRICVGQVVATTPEYAEVNDLELAEGRFLSPTDDLHFRNVVVLGSAVAEELFPLEEPLGATIVFNKGSYVVVGIVREQDETVNGPAARIANRRIYLPLRTCQAHFGERMILRRGGSRYAEAVPLHTLLVTVRDAGECADTAEDIRDLLEQAHEKKDWSVQEPSGP